MSAKTIIVTGGAGFIGSAVVRELITNSNHIVVNLDKLTYAGNLESLKSVVTDSRYHFEQVDICDAVSVKRVLETYQPDIIIAIIPCGCLGAGSTVFSILCVYYLMILVFLNTKMVI